MTDDELEAEYWGYSQYDDYEDEDDYYDDPGDWDGPDIYYCPICGKDEREIHDAEAHRIHDSAEDALNPQLDYYRCNIDGHVLEFHAYCPPDEDIAEDYALALCRECGEYHTVIHTKDTRRIIAVYLGLGGHFNGIWGDQPDSNEPLPF